MKRPALILLAIILCALAASALASDTVIEPAYPVPDYVTWLLETASAEVGYREGDHGYSKYGEWAGDPYAQWCAEFLCWSVYQVDCAHGTELLNRTYPLYSGSNSGRAWFIRNGRFIARNGNLDDWGYQWLPGESEYITTGSYVPQPGDWVFFTWTSDTNTDHVAMVEYCTRDERGNVTIHVIEGNNPSAVQRNTYPITYKRILGYGTVHDCAEWTMRMGNIGEKVRQLQEKLVLLRLLDAEKLDGIYGQATMEAIRSFQATHDLKVNGIANIATQAALNKAVDRDIFDNPLTWVVVDEDDDWDSSLTFLDIPD